MFDYIKPSLLSLKGHPTLNEKWVQDRIAEEPSILGLGDLGLRDKERCQTMAGRLDLLLEDFDTNRRYEVEVQLGKTDPSHIIRTVEYWDIECKRYPLYDHCAVIVAEEITSRFLNVISLFNRAIPLIAIQMQAIQIEDKITLVFTKVVDERHLGPEPDQPGPKDVVGRPWWDERRPKGVMGIADSLLGLLNEVDAGWTFTYNKGNIHVRKNGQDGSFLRLRPRMRDVLLVLSVEASREFTELVEATELETLSYFRGYRVVIDESDVKDKGEAIKALMRQAMEMRRSEGEL